MKKEIMQRFFPAEVARFDAGLCPSCAKPTRPEEFLDATSLKEYRISGLCQECQDRVFRDV